MPGTPGSIFISYSRRDSSFVDKLEADLSVRHFSTWVDRRNIESTQSWKRILQDAIDQHDMVLIVISPAAIASRLVQMEYAYALRTGKPLLALEYQPCPVLPDDLQGVPRIAFTIYKEGLSDLFSNLNRAERDPSSEPAVVSYLEQARRAQNASEWRRAAGYWQALLEIEPRNSEARHFLEQNLRAQGREANASGAWDQAISGWEVLLKLNPSDAQATRQLLLARKNQSYSQYYEDARQFIAENQPMPAGKQLRLLWQYAPFYGDPEGLALKADVTKPLRSPATLDREAEEWKARECARLEEERRKREKQEADERERARLEDERRKREKREADERERIRLEKERSEREEWEKRERLMLEKLEQERVEEEAREKAKLAELQRSPGWFIQHQLCATRAAVWSSFFFLLSGLGCAVGIITQSLLWTFVSVAIISIAAYVLGYHRTIHRLPERLRQRAGQNTLEEEAFLPDAHETLPSMAIDIIAPLAVVVISCLIAFFFISYLSQLKYNVELTGQLLGFTRSWWLGRQIKVGLAIGTILSFIVVFIFEPWKALSAALRDVLTLSALFSFLFMWLICALFGSIIDLGWGLGDGWEVSLFGFIVGIIGGTGLASSFVIWVKGKPIF